MLPLSYALGAESSTFSSQSISSSEDSTKLVVIRELGGLSGAILIGSKFLEIQQDAKSQVALRNLPNKVT